MLKWLICHLRKETFLTNNFQPSSSFPFFPFVKFSYTWFWFRYRLKKLKHLIHTMISAELTTKKKQWNNFLPLLSWHWFLRLCFFFFEGHCYLLNMISGMRRFKKFNSNGKSEEHSFSWWIKYANESLFLHFFMLFVVVIVNMIFNKYEQIHKHIYIVNQFFIALSFWYVRHGIIFG